MSEWLFDFKINSTVINLSFAFYLCYMVKLKYVHL